MFSKFKFVSSFGLLMFLAGCNLCTQPAWSQSAPSRQTHEVDLAFTYSPVRQNGVSGTSFWQQGGTMELSAEAYRGFGIAMALSGGTAHNANNSGVDINTINVAFGPKYTYTHHRLAIFGEGLIGISNAFNGVYPGSQGSMSSDNSLAARAGGGLDLRLSRHFAVRPVEAYWLHTQMNNATTNVQNALALGAGIVLRLQR